MKNKNITLLNPFVWENFWDKYNDFESVEEAQNLFNEFVSSNEEKISKIDELIESGNFQILKENFGYDFESDSINEARLGRRATQVQPETSRSYSDDDFAEDVPFSGIRTKTGKTPTRDDIESALTSSSVRTISKKRPDETDVDIKVVRNVGYDSHSMSDIHYCVQAIYEKLLKNKKNYTKITALSLLNTEDVVEMDALFAFMDIPNVDLSPWDTSNVKNMEGMFYKSTFNNDSIKNWDVSNVTNMRNMFIGSDMTNPEYISNWYPNTQNHALPKLGIDVADSLDDETAIDKTFGSDKEIERKYRQRMSYQNESWHVMSSSEFITEGHFTDYLKTGVQKIKNVISNIAIKVKDGMTYLFDKMGNMLNVITPNAMVGYLETNNVNGVCFGDEWQEKNGTYDRIEKGSQEYNNYMSFLDYASSMGTMNEARVTMSSNKSKKEGAAAPNIDVEDWNTAQLSKYIEKQVTLTQKRPGREKHTLVVWGAPGIGKSSIPKTIIREMNDKMGRKSESGKMTVIVADCSQMSSDGFSLPTPAKQLEINKIVQSNAAAAEIAKNNGISDEELESIEYKVSSDAPKTWLPVYKPTGDHKKDEILNALANGATQPIVDKDGYISGFEKTGSGGILLIDEFLRADQNVFFIVCQLMFNYSFGEYVLGDKWQILAASNRPSDDKEVRRKYADAAGAGFNRLAACNFIPSFEDWKKWAVKHGFDETTLSFIAEKGFDTPDSRWHNFDPELKNSQNSPLFASPRSWSDAIQELMDECEFSGYRNYSEIPRKEFYRLIAAHLPEKLSQEYTDYYFINNTVGNPYTYDKIIENTSLKVDDKNKYKCANVVNNIVTTIKLRYDKKNRIPVNEFVSLMKFLCDNYSDSNIIYPKFYEAVFKICDLAAPEENPTPEEIAIENSYDEVGDIFANKFPAYVEALNEQ